MKNFLKNLKLNEEKISFFLGLLAVFLVGALLVNYFRSVNRPTGQTTSASTSANETSSGEIKSLEEIANPGQVNLPAEYIIKKGDNLWKIAAAVYGDGYSWDKIYEANKTQIADPDVLNEGTRITLPRLESEITEYTVVKGDTLWGVSEKICHTGFAWTTIAADNSISNPKSIEPGLVLKVRCR